MSAITSGAATLAALIALSGCVAGPAIDLDGPDHVGAGEGPADTQTIEPTPAEEVPDSEQMPSFDQKFIYDDGVEVEVIKIEKGAISRKQAEEYAQSHLIGQPYAAFTVRVRNGSEEMIDASLIQPTIASGPDGVEPEMLILWDVSMSGKIPPGKAKSATWGYVIPERHWKDVILQVDVPDEGYTRDPAIFMGAI